jgi:hypothetical protein
MCSYVTGLAFGKEFELAIGRSDQDQVVDCSQDQSNCEKRLNSSGAIKQVDVTAQGRSRRNGGGQPGNSNAVKHGRFTQEATRRRAAIQASRREARQRLAEAKALYREARAL